MDFPCVGDRLDVQELIDILRLAGLDADDLLRTVVLVRGEFEDVFAFSQLINAGVAVGIRSGRRDQFVRVGVVDLHCRVGDLRLVFGIVGVFIGKRDIDSPRLVGDERVVVVNLRAVGVFGVDGDGTRVFAVERQIVAQLRGIDGRDDGDGFTRGQILERRSGHQPDVVGVRHADGDLSRVAFACVRQCRRHIGRAAIVGGLLDAVRAQRELAALHDPLRMEVAGEVL